MIVKLENIRLNPFRNLREYPVVRDKIDRHKENIKRDGLWKGMILAREKPGEEGVFELAFGTHRYYAMIELNKEFPDSGYDVMSLVIDNMDDETIQNRMIKENEESSIDDDKTVKHKILSVDTAKNLIETAVRETSGNYEDLPKRVQQAFLNEHSFDVSYGMGNSIKNNLDYKAGKDVILRYLGDAWSMSHVQEILKYIDRMNSLLRVTDGGEIKRPIHRAVAERAEKLSHAKALTAKFQEVEPYVAFSTEEEQLEVLDEIDQEYDQKVHAGENVPKKTAKFYTDSIQEKALQKIERESIPVEQPAYKKAEVLEETMLNKEDQKTHRNKLSTNRKYFESTIQSFLNVTVPVDSISPYPEHLLHYDRALLLKDVTQRMKLLQEYDEALGCTSITNTRVYDAIDCDDAEEWEIMKVFFDLENDGYGKLPPVEEWIDSDLDSIFEEMEVILKKYKQKDKFSSEN